MTTPPSANLHLCRDDDQTPEDGDLSRAERLLSRVVDGEATDAEWTEFRRLADRELPPGAHSSWRDLASAQRDQAFLSAAIGDALSAAERTEAPARGVRRVVTPGHPIAGRIVATGGWMAAAAALTLAWANGTLSRVPTGNVLSQGNTASVIPAGYVKVDTPEDAVNLYKAKGKASGQVIEELPQRVLVQAEPKVCCPGEYTVVYVRQFVEKAEVKDLYRYAHDEAGQPRLIRAGMPVESVHRVGGS